MNNNITEDYCSFEVCKLLKEKGFTNSQFYRSNLSTDYVFMYQEDDDDPNKYSIKDIKEEDCDIEGNYLRPTQSIVLKWLRENFKIIISVVPFTLDVATMEVSLSLDIHPKEPEDSMWSYYIHCNRKFTYDETDFSSSKEATEAALLYTLKNLI